MRDVVLALLFFNFMQVVSVEAFIKQQVQLPLKDIKQGSKVISLSVGFGSGAFHHVKDDKSIVYFITDRGPNIPLEGAEDGKIFPMPTFTPSIYKVDVSDNSYKVLEKIELKNSDGKPLTGLTNPNSEVSYGVDGSIIADDPDGLDAEAIIKLSDGSFWVSEEYSPSLVHVSQEGKVLLRVVPEGIKGELKGSSLKIEEGLPRILSKRKVNRGIEGLAVSPDEKYLYFMLQSALANPDKTICKRSRIARFFRFDLLSNKVDREYVYVIDNSRTFNDDKNVKQGDIKVSELAMINSTELLVLERAENTTKFYKVDVAKPTNILGTKWDDIKNSPSLEELSYKRLIKNKIIPLKKKLVMDTSKQKEKFPVKLEGMAHLYDDEWVLINDNDFGIYNTSTEIIRTSLKL